jgi:DNA-binding transcriptional ArsR family regulator
MPAISSAGATMETNGFAKIENKAFDIAQSLNVFANDQRIRILCRLASATGELPIMTIAADLGIGQSALSQHLTKLRKSGAIAARRTGHNLFYRIADPRVAALAIALQKFIRSRAIPGRESRPSWQEMK